MENIIGYVTIYSNVVYFKSRAIHGTEVTSLYQIQGLIVCAKILILGVKRLDSLEYREFCWIMQFYVDPIQILLKF